VIVGLSDGRIPWPIGKRHIARSLVIGGGLERAIRTESAAAIKYWFGVSGPTVWKWRRALGVPAMNRGSVQLRRELLAPRGDAMRARRDSTAPAFRAKMAAIQRGKKRPRRALEPMWRATRGRPLSPNHCRQISERNKARGIRPTPWQTVGGRGGGTDPHPAG
jgi:hypothetical protein